MSSPAVAAPFDSQPASSPATGVRKVPHCAIRARERYGIDLTWGDIEAISDRCAKGEGCTERNQDGSQFHLIVFAERVLWIVYKPPCAESPVRGVILTVMPPSIYKARSARDAKHQKRRHRQKPNFRRAWK